MNTQSNQSNNEIKMPNNFKYPNRCRLMWNVKLQKNEWVQYLGGGQDCAPELVDTKMLHEVIADYKLQNEKLIEENKLLKHDRYTCDSCKASFTGCGNPICKDCIREGIEIREFEIK